MMGYTNILILLERNMMSYIMFTSGGKITNVSDVMLNKSLEENRNRLRVLRKVHGTDISDGGMAVIKYNDLWIKLDTDAYATLKDCDLSVMLELAKFYTRKIETA